MFSVSPNSRFFVACMLKVQKLSGIPTTETLVTTPPLSARLVQQISIVMAKMIIHLINNGIGYPVIL